MTLEFSLSLEILTSARLVLLLFLMFSIDFLGKCALLYAICWWRESEKPALHAIVNHRVHAELRMIWGEDGYNPSSLWKIHFSIWESDKFLLKYIGLSCISQATKGNVILNEAI